MKKLVVILAMLFTSWQSQAQDFSVDLGASVFKLDETDLRWELYYSFPENAISYIMVDDKYIGALNFSIKFVSTSKTEQSEEWSITHSVLQPPDSFKQKLFGIRAFRLTYGQYQVELKISDPNNPNTLKLVKFPIIVKKINDDRLEMSDLMLSNLILREDQAGEYANSMFLRNAMYVYPNPSSEYYGSDPKLNVYTEIYNSETIGSKTIELHYRIFDGAAREVFYFPKTIPAVHDGIVETIEIPLNALSTGVYNLVLSAKSSGTKDSVFKTAKFFLNNFDMPPSLDINITEDLAFERSEFSTLTPERIELEYRRVRMIAEKDEKQQFALLTDPKAKAKFMYLFWKKRDSDTTSPLNTQLAEHRRRIDIANTYFSYGKNDNGWDTDRGHILLRFGEPTKKDYSPHKGDERQYETWFYGEIEGGVFFNFVDVGGFGDYKLVHSTKQGEFYNEDWYNIYVPISKDKNRMINTEGSGY